MASGPLQLGVADLRRAPGTHRSIHLELIIGDLGRDRIGNADVELPVAEPLTAELALDSSPGHLDVTGTLLTTWSGHCRRCLDVVAGTLEVDVDERFAVRPELHSDHDAFPIIDDHIDLAPMMIESLLVSLPLLPLCRPDCPGPDPDAHPITVAAEVEPTTDPRWAALDELRAD